MAVAVQHTTQHINDNDPAFTATHAQNQVVLDYWAATQTLSKEHIAGRRVLHWQSGTSAYPALLLENGAEHVTAIDSDLDPAAVHKIYGSMTNFRFGRMSLEQLATDPASQEAFDLIFANSVTERIVHLPRMLAFCYRLLAPNGILFVNHDNYYQPMGSYDHGLLGYEGNKIVTRGPRCWESAEKCATSEAFRRSMAEEMPWVWDDWTELQRDPSNCQTCPFYRRSQPWAHLIYQQDFRQVFPQASFTSGYMNSKLNKVTLFQLRQFLIEAGFDIDHWQPYTVSNQPPEELLRPPFGFSINDLCTATVAIRCSKGMLPSYQILER